MKIPRKELRKTDVVTELKHYQTKWWEHVEKMEAQRITEKLLKKIE
jgi:hypothetical protein